MVYRHYIPAAGEIGQDQTRLIGEGLLIQADSGGAITSDTLSFYVRDEVGSVIATVTENLGVTGPGISDEVQV